MKVSTGKPLLEHVKGTIQHFHLPQTFQALLGLSIHKGQWAVLPAHLPTGIYFHILVSHPQTRSISVHLANTSEQHIKMWCILLLELKDAYQSLGIFLSMGAKWCSRLCKRYLNMSHIIGPTETSLRWHVSIMKFISNLIMCTCHPEISRIPAISC